MGKSKKSKKDKVDKREKDRERAQDWLMPDEPLEPLPEPIAEHTPEPRAERRAERVFDLWSVEKVTGRSDDDADAGEPAGTPIEREVVLLDGLLHALEDDVQAGNLEAIQTALQISESRRRLLGLETHDLSGAVTVNVGTDLASATAPAATTEPDAEPAPTSAPVLVTVLNACDDDLLPSRAALR